MTLPAPAPPRSQPRLRRGWLVAVTVAWALVLAAVAYLSVRRDEPTVRDQRTAAEARPIVDRAVGELAAAGGSDVVLHISGYEVSGDCRITPVRSGETLQRKVTIYTREADGPALLDRMAGRLPASYQARAWHTEERDSLRADAGEFVTVSGGVTAPGVVILTVGTGCRPPSDLDAAPQPADRGQVTPIFTALGAVVAEASAAEAPCPGGGTVRTIWANGELTAIPARPFPRPPGAFVVIDTPERYAYRSAAESVSVDLDPPDLEVASTTPC